MSFVYVGNHDPKFFPAEEMADMLSLTNDGQFVWIPMPVIETAWTEAQVYEASRDIAGMVLSYNPDAAMVIGEYSVTINTNAILQAHGVGCYFGVSERVASEVKLPDGTTEMKHTFRYDHLRKCPSIRLA